MIFHNPNQKILALLYLLTLVACGAKKDYGKDIDISVIGTGMISPVANPNCADKIAMKADSTVSARSASKNSMIFRGFKLTWRNPNKTLYVGRIRVSATGTNISGGTFSTDLTSVEMEDLLAAPNTQIAVPNGATSVTIQSNDTGARGASSPYAACGLTVGGMSLIKDDQSFTANVTIDLVGNASDSDGNTETVKKTVNAQAEF